MKKDKSPKNYLEWVNDIQKQYNLSNKRKFFIVIKVRFFNLLKQIFYKLIRVT